MATIRIIPGSQVTGEYMQHAVALLWDSQRMLESGERIRFGAGGLRQECLFDVDKCFMAVAVEAKERTDEAASADDPELLGYCFYSTRGPRPLGHPQVWISLLLVRPGYRSQGLATSLLQACWNDTRCFAMGLVTSHPHAVLALERATQRLITHGVVASIALGMIRASEVPYLNDAQAPLALLENRCVVTTQFHADRSEVDELHRSITNWRFGSLDAGQQYVAIVSRECPLIVALRPGMQSVIPPNHPEIQPDQPGQESEHPGQESEHPGIESAQAGKESLQAVIESAQALIEVAQAVIESAQRVIASAQALI